MQKRNEKKTKATEFRLRRNRTKIENEEIEWTLEGFSESFTVLPWRRNNIRKLLEIAEYCVYILCIYLGCNCVKIGALFLVVILW